LNFGRVSQDWSGALCLVISEDEGLSPVGRAIDERIGGQLSRAIEAAQFTGAKSSSLELLAPAGTGATRIVLVGAGKAEEASENSFEVLGGFIAGKLLDGKDKKASVVLDEAPAGSVDPAEAVARMAFGIRLRAYRFSKYRTGKKAKPPELKSVTFELARPAPARSQYRPLDKLADGVLLARDLVNEPANILGPVAFADRVKALTKLGLTVQVLNEPQLKKLGMAALLGVGQGSANPSRLVVMRWQGGAKGAKPLAFVGKGVTFDTGGISLKKAAGMEHMKGDMGGAACVTGLMCALAGREAKVNAVGIIGLVENMPDGAAQRPGDIVTSMSGQTIEILNTDAEGRLVLADALWYTQKRFKPKIMIDLATLTGAIIVALGHQHAGIFSNDDTLAEQLAAAGEASGEKVWRLPLASEYDKQLDSKNADMKNIGGMPAGSITAAQFLQKFVNKCTWAHIDIAGTAMSSPQTEINKSWGSGFGVRLLNRLVEQNYER